MRLKLISCEVFYREFNTVVARSPHTVDSEYLPKALHDIGTTGMRERLQAVVDRVTDPAYDAILLGYGLCNNGIVGTDRRDKRLVVPRAHDCITLFLGSKERYLDYFQNNARSLFSDHRLAGTRRSQRRVNQLSVWNKPENATDL